MDARAVCSAVVRREIAPQPDPLAVYEALRDRGHPWLLESALRRAGTGRHSFVGADPYLVLRARGRRVEIEHRRCVRPDLDAAPGHVETRDACPLETARALLPPAPIGGAAVPFVGGAIGYWGYELGEQTEPVSLRARDDLGLPDLSLAYVDRLIAFDHEDERCLALGLGFGPDEAAARDAAQRACDDVASVAEKMPAAVGRRRAADAARRAFDAPLPQDLALGLDEPAYAEAVRAILRDVEAGNVYQANLTQRMERPYRGSAVALYRALRRANPAPFAALLELPGFAIVGSSPERYLRVDHDGAVESRPIKGTRPRGGDATEDARLEAELAASVKDRAENLMIVDLVRNDLGRVCETGSIEVPQLMEVERYASVFQLVSAVRGRLAEGRDVTDLLRATFPPGSMTGAPKIAAMRIIDRHEPVRRGVYSGAIGYLDARGGADLSVVIRTAVLKDGTAYLHAGGGIVADSDPAAEYAECLDKVRALVAALEDASG